ncbi:DUF2000 family protein [Roseibium porphyridii]|uniref:DUF2000 family protein n=1 Tax=Roseibium porphyridii TaxID=2866279 RepID=A0ABY8EYN1_9HYPH|nr:DUF2000 family protein [Roseibium sp. KMA01]WFE88226.1 DUF2000 family protein [Roseibium sp. KMA01]
MFETKFVVVVRDDLAVWQKLNVTAFLATGIASAKVEIIGENYRDAANNVYYPMSVQPIIVLCADAETLAKIQQRALNRDVSSSLYVEEMFATGHDTANREVFSKFSPDNANVVGIAFHTDRKTADKISKGARMHP